jgi:glucan phosphoethanolaminetransferase (alkaline phosphatase superfamily)
METQLKKHLLYNIVGAAFLALFGAVYEVFSHQVYSYFMLYAFAIPLALGVLPYAVLLLKEKYPSKLFLNLWNTAIAALCVGSVFAGVLAIYGTTNSLVIVYPIAGGLLMLVCLASLLVKSSARRQTKTRCDQAARF